MTKIKDTYVSYSPQIEAMGEIDLSEDFSLDRKYFLIKNEGGRSKARGAPRKQ